MDRTGYSIAEHAYISGLYFERLEEQHGPSISICSHCWDWAKTEYLVRVLEAALA